MLSLLLFLPSLSHFLHPLTPAPQCHLQINYQHPSPPTRSICSGVGGYTQSHLSTYSVVWATIYLGTTLSGTESLMVELVFTGV